MAMRFSSISEGHAVRRYSAIIERELAIEPVDNGNESYCYVVAHADIVDAMPRIDRLIAKMRDLLSKLEREDQDAAMKVHEDLEAVEVIEGAFRLALYRKQDFVAC